MEEREYPIKLSYEDLRTYTDNFSDENYIGEFQFGKVYHGKITLPGSVQPKPVTVKRWEIPWFRYYENENAHRLMDELVFLQTRDISHHPGLMKLYGYCIEPEQCGIVYDFKAYNTVFNLAPTDEFKWLERIKVALRFAQLLRFLHVKYKGKSPLLIRNIHASHVMVDEDWNPRLYDFGMISGAMFPNKLLFRVQHIEAFYGSEESMGKNTQKSDVRAFGIVLLCLIMKEVHTDEDIRRQSCMLSRALRKHGRDRDAYRRKLVECRRKLVEYTSGFSTLENEDEEEDDDNDVETFKFPLVHESFEDEEDEEDEEDAENFQFSLVHESFEAEKSFYARDGPTISRLALACVDTFPGVRPTMNQVVNQLQKLRVVRRHLNVYIEEKTWKKENIPS